MNFENFDPYFPDQPVVDLYLPLWANLPAFSSKPTFIWADAGAGAAVLTYRQLHDSVQLISEHLLAQLHRRDTVVVLCSPGLELVEVLFGCQRAGLLTVPIMPPEKITRENCHHLARALSQTKPKAAVAHGGFISGVFRYVSSAGADDNLAVMLQSVRWISTEEIKRKKMDSGRDFSDATSYRGCRPEEAYLIQYTSGATGIPKPVVVCAGAAAHNVRAARGAYDLQPNSVIISWLPPYHDCGLMFLLLTVVSGATCVLTSPARFVTQPMTWIHLISQFKATCTPVPSFTLPLVVRRQRETPTGGFNLSGLRNLILINEPIYRSAVEEFVDVFRPFGLNPGCISPSYGLAENCTFVSTSWRRTSCFAEMPSYKKLLPCGRLGWDCSEEGEKMKEMGIVVVDEESHEAVDDGVEGEIWVSSHSNASGYLGQPCSTRETFHGRLSKNTSRRYVRTGDRGVITGEDRYLFVVGRSSDILKLHNHREIHPHYIETAAYKSCPQILRGGCIAAVEISETVAVVAEMQRAAGAEELRKICRGMRRWVVAEEGVEIGAVILVGRGSVPKTTSGKMRRWEVESRVVRGEMSVVMAVRFGGEVFCSLSKPSLMSLL